MIIDIILEAPQDNESVSYTSVNLTDLLVYDNEIEIEATTNKNGLTINHNFKLNKDYLKSHLLTIRVKE